MKRTILTLAVLLGVATANFTYAGEKNAASIELVSATNLKFKLTLEQVEARSTVMIKNDMGEIIYSANLPKSDSYEKIYDLSNFMDGDYQFVIINGKDITTKDFKIKTETKRLVSSINE